MRHSYRHYFIKQAKNPVKPRLPDSESSGMILANHISMKLAISIWNTRIAPVFDAAEDIELYAVDGDNPPRLIGTEKRTASDTDNIPFDTLLCGAISRTAHDALVRRGVRIYPFISGETKDVLTAFQKGEPYLGHFAMPGCACRGRGCGRRRRLGKNCE
jgi:predicted Fe-Mo cluster-binding NifX family protein